MTTPDYRLMLAGPQVRQGNDWVPCCFVETSRLLSIARQYGGIELCCLYPAARASRWFCVWTDSVAYGVGEVRGSTQQICPYPESLYSTEEAAKDRMVEEMRRIVFYS